MAKKLKFEDLKHGMRVRCEIDGVEISDAKISKIHVGKIYICQNVKDGSGITDKLGYKYSWFVSDSRVGAFNIQSIEKDINDIDTYEVGDVLVYRDGDKYTVMAVTGKLIAISPYDKSERFDTDDWYTTEELLSGGYEFKDQPEEEDEVSDEMKEAMKLLKDNGFDVVKDK